MTSFFGSSVIILFPNASLSLKTSGSWTGQGLGGRGGGGGQENTSQPNWSKKAFCVTDNVRLSHVKKETNTLRQYS